MAATNRVRKPAHLEQVGGKGKRQLIWEAIRQQRDDFTAYTMARRSGVEDTTVKTYLLSLEKGGFIEQLNANAGFGVERHYCLRNDAGLEAPRLNRDGRPVIQGLAQEQMWRTMRITGGDFNYQELAGLASTAQVTVSPVAARDYLKHLANAGYVVVIQKGKGRGAGGIPTRFRFNRARYTGPRPPMVQKTKSIYDPNLGKVVWQETIHDDDL